MTVQLTGPSPGPSPVCGPSLCHVQLVAPPPLPYPPPPPLTRIDLCIPTTDTHTHTDTHTAGQTNDSRGGGPTRDRWLGGSPGAVTAIITVHGTDRIAL